MWRALLIFFTALFASAQQSGDYSVEKLLGGFQYASAVAWHQERSGENFLLIADLPGGKITRVDSKGPSVFTEGVHASGLAQDSDGRIYICDPHKRQVTRTDKKGRAEVLAESFEGRKFNGPHGIVVSKSGVWFTDPAFASADKQKELSFYGVYHLNSKGELSLTARMAGRPNGIALSPDSKVLYVVDSDSRTVLAWDLDKSGAASNQRVLARIQQGVPTGMLAGPDGKLYVAASGVEIFTPQGQEAGRIEMSEKPAGLTFGDSDQGTLYIAARTSVYRVKFRAVR